MSKKIDNAVKSVALTVVPADASMDIVTKERIEARTAYITATRQDHGATQRYAKALMAAFGAVPLFWKPEAKCKEFAAEIAAYKEGCGDGVDKATLRKRVQYVRMELDQLAGVEKAGANETRDIFTRISEDVTRLYKALMKAELSVQWANDDLADLGKVLKRHKVDLTSFG